MFFPFTALTLSFEYDYVHVQGYRCPLLSFFIGLGQCSMFLTYNDKNNAVVRTVIKTLWRRKFGFRLALNLIILRRNSNERIC